MDKQTKLKMNTDLNLFVWGDKLQIRGDKNQYLYYETDRWIEEDQEYVIDICPDFFDELLGPGYIFQLIVPKLNDAGYTVHLAQNFAGIWYGNIFLKTSRVGKDHPLHYESSEHAHLALGIVCHKIVMALSGTIGNHPELT